MCNTTDGQKLAMLYVKSFDRGTVFTGRVYPSNLFECRLSDFSVLLCLPRLFRHPTENKWQCVCPQKCVDSSQPSNFLLLFLLYCHGLFFLCCLLRKMNGSGCIYWIIFSSAGFVLDDMSKLEMVTCLSCFFLPFLSKMTLKQCEDLASECPFQLLSHYIANMSRNLYN